MATDREEPGFEADVNEIPAQRDNGAEDRLEEAPTADTEASDLEEAQKDAAEERKEGGYQ